MSLLDPKLLAQSYVECTRRAKAHYENFPVGLFVPPRLQPHVHAVYAFARYADDLADEGYDGDCSHPEGLSDNISAESRLSALLDWERQLSAPPGSAEVHLIFPALHDSMQKLELPASLFRDLISAFKQDVIQHRYENFEQVLDYCRRSANPIGRLVLMLHGIRDEGLHKLSDEICTALQLTNFWQDVGLDLKKNRIYLPQSDLNKFGVTEEMLFARECTPQYRDLLHFQVDRTQAIFNRGEPLTQKLRGKLRLEIRATWMGGTTILRKIEKLNFDTLNARPKLSKLDMVALLSKALIS